MQNWRSITAAFLLAVYACSATAAGELLKIPRLVTHYLHHSREPGGSSLVNFLFEHYFTENGTDDDAREDSELPFKSPIQNATNVDVAPPPQHTGNSIPVNIPEIAPVYIIRNEWLPASQYLACIWQPPRRG